MGLMVDLVDLNLLTETLLFGFSNRLVSQAKVLKGACTFFLWRLSCVGTVLMALEEQGQAWY